MPDNDQNNENRDKNEKYEAQQYQEQHHDHDHEEHDHDHKHRSDSKDQDKEKTELKNKVDSDEHKHDDHDHDKAGEGHANEGGNRPENYKIHAYNADEKADYSHADHHTDEHGHDHKNATFDRVPRDNQIELSNIIGAEDKGDIGFEKARVNAGGAVVHEEGAAFNAKDANNDGKVNNSDVIDATVADLVENPDLFILLEGHASSDDTAKNNAELAQGRLDNTIAVIRDEYKAELVQQGVPAAEIQERLEKYDDQVRGSVAFGEDKANQEVDLRSDAVVKVRTSVDDPDNHTHLAKLDVAGIAATTNEAIDFYPQATAATKAANPDLTFEVDKGNMVFIPDPNGAVIEVNYKPQDQATVDNFTFLVETDNPQNVASYFNEETNQLVIVNEGQMVAKVNLDPELDGKDFVVGATTDKGDATIVPLANDPDFSKNLNQALSDIAEVRPNANIEGLKEGFTNPDVNLTQADQLQAANALLEKFKLQELGKENFADAGVENASTKIYVKESDLGFDYDGDGEIAEKGYVDGKQEADKVLNKAAEVFSADGKVTAEELAQFAEISQALSGVVLNYENKDRGDSVSASAGAAADKAQERDEGQGR